MEVIDVLESSPLFAGLGRPALAQIGAALIRESWPRHCQIVAPTEAVDRFWIVARGRVKITRSNRQTGRELTLWLLGPGEGFDLVTLLDGEPDEVSVWTLDAVETLSAPVYLFRDWLERYPALRLAMHRYIARQLRELTDKATDLGLHDTMTRLARLLLHHVSCPRGAGANRMDLIQDLPQEELASLIGSVRVVISRLLAQLKREGIVDIRNGEIRIANLKRLLRRAEAQIERTFGHFQQDSAGGCN